VNGATGSGILTTTEELPSNNSTRKIDPMAIFHRTVEWAIRDVREAVDQNDNPSLTDVVTVLNAFEDLIKDLEEVRLMPPNAALHTLEDWLNRFGKEVPRDPKTIQQDIHYWTNRLPILYRKKARNEEDEEDEDE
jgi:hypothetical protein